MNGFLMGLRQGLDGLKQLTHSSFSGPLITVSLAASSDSHLLNHSEQIMGHHLAGTSAALLLLYSKMAAYSCFIYPG